MNTLSNRNDAPARTCFEDLPDEMLLLICRYLSPIEILRSFLNLNKRLNQTIVSYRQKISLSHLSYNDFQCLINEYIPYLSSNVCQLYINNCSMLNAAHIFEQNFKIDQRFPELRELIFHQIDIETLENLSWRFDKMQCLRRLDIDITEARLSSMPVNFDQFICGKLFASLNKFEKLKLNLNTYKFSLQSINQTCRNIRQLTISVKCLADLYILFDYFPNLEELDITIGCSLHYDPNNDSYAHSRLSQKVRLLTKFHLSITEKHLISHENVISNNVILQIVKNIPSLKYFKFILNINFSLSLQSTTTEHDHIEKYLPYANGALWESALKRNEDQLISFELYIQLDRGFGDFVKKKMDPSGSSKYGKHDFGFNSLLKTTFSTANWLQKNINIKCFSDSSKYISIHTIPMKISRLTTNINEIDQQISSTPCISHTDIKNLVINSNYNECFSKISIRDLFSKFPNLIHLSLDTIFILPPNRSICSVRLRSLSINNYSLHSCCQLLNHLPRVISLSITNSFKVGLDVDSCSKSIQSITRLKYTTDSNDENNLLGITQYFPNVKEFYLIIRNTNSRSLEDFYRHENIHKFSEQFRYLRYIEMTLPLKYGLISPCTAEKILNSERAVCVTISNHQLSILKAWY